MRALIEDLGVVAETARPKVKTVIVRRGRESDPVEKNDGVKGRALRDPLL